MKLSRKNKALIYIVLASSMLFVTWMIIVNDVQGMIKAYKGIDSALIYSQDINDTQINDFETSLAKVDSNVVHNFLRHNGIVCIYTPHDFKNVLVYDFTNNNQDLSLFEYIGGYCAVESNLKPYKVDVDYSIKVSTDYTTIALAHEFGHYIDYVSGSTPHLLYTENGAISDSPEFQAIYEEERYNSGLNAYFTNLSTEYFAESYKQMKLNPDYYYEVCPKTCAFIDEVVKNL